MSSEATKDPHDYEPFDRMAAAVHATMSAAELQKRGVKVGCPPENFFPFMLGCVARTDPDAATRIMTVINLALFDHAEDVELMTKKGALELADVSNYLALARRDSDRGAGVSHRKSKTRSKARGR